MRPFLRNILVAAAGSLISSIMAISGSADVRHGLDQRPANATCLAPALASGGQGRLVNAFAPPSGPALAFTQPIALDQSPSNPARWYVAERKGLIKTFTNAFAPPVKIALNISARFQFTDTSGERDSQQWGITALALHPNFGTNGYVFVAYNRKPAPNRPVISYVSRFKANPDRTSFDAEPERVLLQLPQDRPWHHVGQIQFGNDGYLYVGFGDGGHIPPTQVAQDPKQWYGKILRIDVDSSKGGKNYGIPPSNPYVNGVAGAPEVYALGFRNPWRFSFDRKTGDLWVADVGWNDREEVDKVAKGGNYGWPAFEGTLCKTPPCSAGSFKFPVADYTHADGPAIIGGYVYRGSAIASLDGVYVFGFGGVTTIWGLDPVPGGSRIEVARMPRPAPTSFGQDASGALYVLNSHHDNIYKLVPDVSGPGRGPGVAQFLSRTGCFDPDSPQRYTEGVIPYDVNSQLWSDGAGKRRAMALPNGGRITVNGQGDFAFPPRTVLIKTFLFNGRPHETRLFMRHPNGPWQGYTYRWLKDLSDAELVPAAGATATVRDARGKPLTWRYPSRAQCLQCHNAAAGFSLGLEIAQLNGDMTYPTTGRRSNQIATLDHIGLFAPGAVLANNELPALARPAVPHTSLTLQARSYLHANCAICHRPGGPAQADVDFRFSTSIAGMKVCNKAPLGSTLGVKDAVLLKPGAPDQSLIALRMRRRGPDQMPPLATTVADAFTIRTITEPWIDRADVCNPVGDADGDGVANNADNCIILANPDQADDDHDGYGNRCDGDLNNDLKTNDADQAALVALVGKRRNAPGFKYPYDLNHNLIIDKADLDILRSLLRKAPGPSALAGR